VDLFGRKIAQPSDDWNVVVGSCQTGQLVWDQGEKAEGQSSVGRKVPSSRAYLDDIRCAVDRLRLVGGSGLDQEAEGEVIGRKPVIVPGKLNSLAKLFRDC